MSFDAVETLKNRSDKYWERKKAGEGWRVTAQRVGNRIRGKRYKKITPLSVKRIDGIRSLYDGRLTVRQAMARLFGR